MHVTAACLNAGEAALIGGAFGLAIGVAVFSGAGSYGSPAAFSDGFGPALGVSAALSLLGALPGLTLRARRRAGAGTAIPGATPMIAVLEPEGGR